MNPLIFDIQRFSIHDGPGIRTVVFFKGCNMVCPWCQNPESMALKPEIAFYPDKCISSFDCKAVCPEKAILTNGDGRINREACTDCGLCVEVCVSGALKLIGKQYSVDAVFEEIMADIDYYKVSGGGVTFSGGEPTLHIDFIYELLKKCKQQGIHTNIETNGYFAWNKFEKLLPLLDLIYFDIKIIEKDKHKSVLAGNSERILDNMKRLLEVNAPVEFRLPLIPFHTSTEENLADVIALLKQYDITDLHILPYHNMGEAKAERINGQMPKLKTDPYNKDELEGFRSFFERQNIRTTLYR